MENHSNEQKLNGKPKVQNESEKPKIKKPKKQKQP